MNTINPQLERTKGVIPYPEPPPQTSLEKTFNYDRFYLINMTLNGLRATYLTGAWLVNYTTSGASRFGEFYQALELPVMDTKVLAVTGVVYAIGNLVKKINKVKNSVGWKLVDHGMNAIRFLGMGVENTSYVLKGLETLQVGSLIAKTGASWAIVAFKVALAAAAPLYGLSVVLYTAAVAVHVRDLYKTKEFKERFSKIHLAWQISKDLKLEHQERDYQKFVKLVENTSDAALKRHFQVDGKLLRARLNYLDKVERSDKKVEALLITLKGRIDSTIHNEGVQIVADVCSIVASALIFTSICNPVGYAFLGVYCLALTVNFGYRKAAAYKFEDQIGLIARSPKDSKAKLQLEEKKSISFKKGLYKTADFMKWICGQQNQFNPLFNSQVLVRASAAA